MSRTLPRMRKIVTPLPPQSYLSRPAFKCRPSRSFRASARQCAPVNFLSKKSPGIEQGPRARAIIATFAAFAAASVTLFATVPTAHADAPSSKDKAKYLRLEEVHQHGRDSERRWVTRGNRVYDIEDWIPNHPGGEVILRAAGGAIEAYWDIFSIHKKEDVYEILEQYFIGLIDDRDLVDGAVPQDKIDDPFKTDPKRDQSLIVHTDKPFNAETPEADLNTFITPTEKHYVRHHLWVPEVDEKSLNLTIELPDGKEKVYTVQELQDKFTQHTITATLQCSGNRRADMSKNTHNAQGLQWGSGAISNASWTGVRLRDVLTDAGFVYDDSSSSVDVKHVQFLGAEAYGASIPIAKALETWGDVLLVHRMNGQPLSRDHGYPLRVLVPGHVAARSVKWLNKIILSSEESQSQWQQKDYKCFGPNERAASIDWAAAPAIQEFPVQSAITKVTKTSSKPVDDDKVEGPSMTIEGYACSGGGRRIVRVDVSTDDGKSWKQAELLHQDEARGHRAWSWTQWRLVVPNDGAGRACVVKAVDEANNTQPENYEAFYNFRGNLTNSWHRVEMES